MSSRQSSREAFIGATASLLRRQGYSATGLNEIVARSGAPKGSLYFHFPAGKQELAAAAMAHAGEQLAVAIEAVLDASEDLPQGIARLTDALALQLESSQYADGCPIATAALEASGESELIRRAAAGAFDSWLAALEARFAADGLDRDAAARRALLVLSAIEGALILARARCDLTPLHAVRDELVVLCG